MLAFPPTPLANEFLTEKKPQDFFPLEVAACAACGHYQLTEEVPPERLFRQYSYAAGHSAANIAHFREAARHQVEKFSLPPGSRVLDIASNDGTLLRAFKDLGMKVLGIDPAENLASEANAAGIPTLAEFFTAARAARIKEEYGTFDLITANNVFAHVPDLEDFARGVETLLAPEGVFSFEVSYFVDVCDKTLFDTIYHEHTSYHTLTPLVPFFNALGMELFDVEHLPNHGGSIRGYVCLPGAQVTGKDADTSRLSSLLAQEVSMERKVTDLNEQVTRLGASLREYLENAKSSGKSVAVFGAPAKATTLMYAFQLDTFPFEFVAEDAPLKQGTYTPGTHIPVVPAEVIAERSPDVLLVLAWNFADSIIERHPDFKGTWVVPLPELKILTP